MKYLQIALNVPANQTFTYANIPAGKRENKEEKDQRDLIPQKEFARSSRIKRKSARAPKSCSETKK